MFRSSYFKISPKGDSYTEEDFSITKRVHDQFGCAMTCNADTDCHFAVFDKDLKKSSLLKAKEKLNRQSNDQSKTRKLLLEKVAWLAVYL